MSLKQWRGGMTGKDLEALDDDFNVGRVDESWPVGPDGAKVSLPPAVCHTMGKMGDGDILVTKNSEAIDPPRKKSTGEKAKTRWTRLVEHTKEGRYPVMSAEERAQRGGSIPRPGEAEVKDVVSGRKIRLGEERKKKEEYLKY